MFYCDACREKYKWPSGLGFRSRGTCEMCKVGADCHDVPSSALPPPKILLTAEDTYERLRKEDP